MNREQGNFYLQTRDGRSTFETVGGNCRTSFASRIDAQNEAKRVNCLTDPGDGLEVVVVDHRGEAT